MVITGDIWCQFPPLCSSCYTAAGPKATGKKSGRKCAVFAKRSLATQATIAGVYEVLVASVNPGGNVWVTNISLFVDDTILFFCLLGRVTPKRDGVAASLSVSDKLGDTMCSIIMYSTYLKMKTLTKKADTLENCRRYIID